MNKCYPNYLAMSYVRLGNPAEAFRWFNRDLDNQCGRTVFDLSADPRLDTFAETNVFAICCGAYIFRIDPESSSGHDWHCQTILDGEK